MKRYENWFFIGALFLPALLLVVCPYPPFQDWPAHAGVIGGLIHRDEPAARLAELYQLGDWLKLNGFFYLPAWALGEFLPPLWAANLVFAGALVLLGFGLRAFLVSLGGDPRLAVLALPLAVGRHVYCGFAPNALALAFWLFALALRFSKHRWAPWGYLLFLLLLAFTHAFIFLAAAGLFLLLELGNLFKQPKLAGLHLGLLGLSGAWFAFLYAQGMGVHGAEGGSAFAAVWEATQAENGGSWAELWEWLFASYRHNQIDDGLQVAWVMVWMAGVFLALWGERRGFFSAWRGQLLALAGVTWLMYAVLPANVGPPVNWWGARLRLPVMGALLLVPLVATAGRSRLYAWGAALVSAAVPLYFSYDLGKIHRSQLQGLDQVLEQIPPGQVLSYAHYSAKILEEYPGVPLGYYGNFYLLQKGGQVPQDFFERNEYPLHRKRNLSAPSWAMASNFTWAAHGQGFDGFLIHTHLTRPEWPFGPYELGQLELVAESGRWRYYKKRSATEKASDEPGSR